MTTEQTIDKLTYLVYKGAGNRLHPSRKIQLEKSWWQFWKSSYRWERSEPTNAEKAMNGKKWVNSYVVLNPYTSLIERIEKVRIRYDMCGWDEAAFFELRVDVAYHCGGCEDHEVEEFKQALLIYGTG